MTKKDFFTLFVALSVVLLCVWMLIGKPTDKSSAVAFLDYPTIAKSGFLRVGIEPNSIDYYLNKGHIEGFHYDLINRFANDHHLKVRYVPVKSAWDCLFALINNEIDVLAMDANPTMERYLFFLYTVPHSFSRHVLVQRKNRKFFDVSADGQWVLLNDSSAVLLLPSQSAYTSSARFLSKDIAAAVSLKKSSSFDALSILDQVENGKVDMTICDEKDLHANASLYKNLDYSVVLSDTMPLSWLVHKDNHSLKDTLDVWLRQFCQTKCYRSLLNKYYHQQSVSRRKSFKNKTLLLHNQISYHDQSFIKYAQKYDLDWRFIAAIAYQESRFSASATGKGGAYGLMQMMPQTARSIGKEDLQSAECQINAGCEHLSQIKKRFEKQGVEQKDIYNFVLAAYNAGISRVENAMKIAAINGLNPTRWCHVEKAMKLLNNDKVLRQAGIKGQKFNAQRTLSYVQEVNIRYKHYCNIVE